MSFRIGFGFDVHQIKEGLPFFMGGIEIDHSKGMVAHSDGDVLIHAICDAMLGAAALGDIGVHFPVNATEFKNIDSKILLKRSTDLLLQHGYKVINIDSTICAEQPKIKPHAAKMQKVLSGIIGIEPSDVSIKATTNEKMGFVGREEGIAVYAVVLISKI